MPPVTIRIAARSLEEGAHGAAENAGTAAASAHLRKNDAPVPAASERRRSSAGSLIQHALAVARRKSRAEVKPHSGSVVVSAAEDGADSESLRNELCALLEDAEELLGRAQGGRLVLRVAIADCDALTLDAAAAEASARWPEVAGGFDFEFAYRHEGKGAPEAAALGHPRGQEAGPLALVVPAMADRGAGRDLLHRTLLALLLYGPPALRQAAARSSWWREREWVLDGTLTLLRCRRQPAFQRSRIEAEVADLLSATAERERPALIEALVAGREEWAEKQTRPFGAIASSLVDALLARFTAAALREKSPFFGPSGAPSPAPRRVGSIRSSLRASFGLSKAPDLETSLGPLLPGGAELRAREAAAAWAERALPRLALLSTMAFLFAFVVRRPLLLAAMLGSAVVLHGSRVLMSRVIEEMVFSATSGAASFSQERVLNLLITTAVCFPAGRFLVLIFWHLLLTRVSSDLYLRLTQHLLAMPAAFFTTYPDGRSLALFANDMQRVEVGLRSALGVSNWAVGLVLAFGYGFYVNPPLAGVVLGTQLVLAFVCTLPAKTASRYADEKQERVGQITGIVQECVLGHATIRDYCYAPRLFRRATGTIGLYLKAAFRSYIFGECLVDVVVGGNVALQAGILLVGALLIPQRRISVAEILTVLSLAWTIHEMVAELIFLIPNVVSSASSVNVIHSFLQFAPEDEETEEEIAGREPHAHRPAPPPPAAGEGELGGGEAGAAIAFRGCFLKYHPGAERFVLHGLSLALPPAVHVSIVGASGCGKSSLLAALCRTHPLLGGSVTLLGGALRSGTSSLREWRRQFCVVAQSPHIFNDTVAANIAVGREGATPEEVQAAARAARLHETVLAMPQGYGTRVSAASLSGGQRQRLALARAIVSAAPVVLLDECTSALDAATEAAVNETIRAVFRGRTVLEVTHRLASTEAADLIVVMDRGRVAEAGPPPPRPARPGPPRRRHLRRAHGAEGRRVPRPRRDRARGQRGGPPARHAAGGRPGPAERRGGHPRAGGPGERHRRAPRHPALSPRPAPQAAARHGARGPALSRLATLFIGRLIG